VTDDRSEGQPAGQAPEVAPAVAPPDRGGRRISRRGLLGTAGVGAIAAAGGVGYALGSDKSELQPTSHSAQAVAFEGTYQAGIVTPAQDRLHFAAYDVTTDDRDELVSLLKEWTEAARAMTAGREVGDGAVAGSPYAPPDDTGEALGLPPSRLTITVGFGPGLFEDADGKARFGLDGQRPPALAALPHFIGDDLRPERSGGDLAIQACADDPQVAVHAIRNLTRIAFGRAELRWSQLGFGRTSSTTAEQITPRNMFGFKDGTKNIKADEADALDAWVWVAEGDGPDWLAGGSYLVARTILMRIETWDREPLLAQEEIVGRTKGSGAPLSGGDEFTEIDLEAKNAEGEPAIPEVAHVRLAHPSLHHGARLLRRGYTFVDGNDELGQLAAGLFFLAYQRNPHTQFVPIQQALADADIMNEYILHVGSAVFACPPGVDGSGWWGETLFG